jgi:UDP-glucose 4-epimerase
MTTVWITGGKGFIGRNLANQIATSECKVFGIGHGAWPGQAHEIWSYSGWMHAEINFSNLNHLASENGLPNLIYHLAGGSAVGPSIKNPYEDFTRTVDTSAKLLDWVRQESPLTRVIGVSSAAVYGSGHIGAIGEQVQVKPFSPYGYHKSMLEALFASYRDTYNLDLGVVRLFSVYGPGLEKQLLWDLCQKLERANNNEILLHGTGEELRDWLHVKDASDLLWKVATSKEMPRIINGGTGVGSSIEKIAQLVVDAWGHSNMVNFSGIGRKGDPLSLVADISKARALDFSPAIKVETGIAEFVKWYKDKQR